MPQYPQKTDLSHLVAQKGNVCNGSASHNLHGTVAVLEVAVVPDDDDDKMAHFLRGSQQARAWDCSWLSPLLVD